MPVRSRLRWSARAAPTTPDPKRTAEGPYVERREGTAWRPRPSVRRGSLRAGGRCSPTSSAGRLRGKARQPPWGSPACGRERAAECVQLDTSGGSPREWVRCRQWATLRRGSRRARARAVGAMSTMVDTPQARRGDGRRDVAHGQHSAARIRASGPRAVESIAANGLRTPVVVTPDGLVLDGRNRAAACEQVGSQPQGGAPGFSQSKGSSPSSADGGRTSPAAARGVSPSSAASARAWARYWLSTVVHGLRTTAPARPGTTMP